LKESAIIEVFLMGWLSQILQLLKRCVLMTPGRCPGVGIICPFRALHKGLVLLVPQGGNRNVYLALIYKELGAGSACKLLTVPTKKQGKK